MTLLFLYRTIQNIQKAGPIKVFFFVINTLKDIENPIEMGIKFEQLITNHQNLEIKNLK
jgi:hypothetical protein